MSRHLYGNNSEGATDRTYMYDDNDVYNDDKDDDDDDDDDA